MTDEEFKKFFEEIRKLNENLEGSHKDTLSLLGHLKDVKGGIKALVALTKQVGLLNQILLQVSKRAGTSGMIQHLFEGILRAAQHGGRRGT